MEIRDCIWINVEEGDLSRPQYWNQVQSVKASDNAGEMNAVATLGCNAPIEILVPGRDPVESPHMLNVVSCLLARIQLGESVVSRVIDVVKSREICQAGATVPSIG